MLGELLARGASAEIYRFGDENAIKLFKTEYSHLAADEAARTRVIRAAGIPCPDVRGLETIEGRIGIVMERIDGPTLLSQGSRSAPALARLHRLVHSSIAADLPHWRQVVDSVKASLGRDERRDFEGRLAGLPDGACVYHGDFHPGNVILSTRGPVIVDWPNACSAHPAVDIARTLVLLRYQGSSPGDGPSRRDRRFQLARDYLHEYLDSSAVEVDTVERALPLHTAGLLRAEPQNPHAEELRRLSDGAIDADLHDLRRAIVSLCLVASRRARCVDQPGGFEVRKRRTVPVVLALLALVGSACGSGKTATVPSTSTSSNSSSTSTKPALTGSITVLAAASLTNGFTALGIEFGATYPGAKVAFSFGSSSDLETQIEQGAPADVYASADQKNMDRLVAADADAGDPVDFAKNKLEIAVEKGNPKQIATLADLTKGGVVVVLCDPSVPCGKFADEVLGNANVSLTPSSPRSQRQGDALEGGTGRGRRGDRVRE